MLQFLLIFIIQTLFFASVFKWLWSRKEMYLLSMKMPGPLSFPFLGSVLSTGTKWPSLKSIRPVFKEYMKHGSPFRVWFFSKFVVVLSDPEDIDSLLADNNVPMKPKMYYFWSQGVGNGLWTGQGGNQWKKHKFLLSPLFSENAMENYGKITEKYCYQLSSSISDNHKQSNFDIRKYLEILSAQLMGYVLLGDDNMSVDDCEKLIIAFRKIELSVNERINTLRYRCWPQCLFKNTDCYQQMQKDRIPLEEYMKDVFEKKKRFFMKQKRLNNENAEESGVYALIKGQYQQHGLGDKEIIEEIMSTYVKGVDSIYNTLTFFILMMAMHKNCQDKLLKEIEDFEQQNGTVELENMNKLKYLDMCYKEVLRLFPHQGLIMRYADRDLRLQNRNITIPKKSYVALPIYFMNLNEKYWKSAKKFDPERFTDYLNMDLYQQIPFGIGQRSCIGEKISDFMIKSIMICLLKQFEFSTGNTMADLKLSFENHIRLRSEYDVSVWKRVY